MKKYWRSWLMVIFLAAVAFMLIRLGLSASGLDRLFREQVPVGDPDRSLVMLAVVAPFAIVLLASLLTSTIGRSSTAVTYGGAWLVYSSLLSQALLSMSGAFLLLFPLILPLERVTYWLDLHPAHKGYLPIQYTAAHEPLVTGLISAGFALIVVGLVDIVKAKRQNRLATEGLYASMRHPQHLGIILWTLGFALWGASVIDMVTWFIISCVFVCLGMHEEGKLTATFNGEYEGYQRRVRFMSPVINVKGPLLPHGGDGREVSTMATIFVLGLATIVFVFFLAGIPR